MSDEKLIEVEVKSWLTGKTIFKGKYESFVDGIEKNKNNLRSANLRFADLKNIPHLNHFTVNDFIIHHEIKREGTKIHVFKGVTEDLESPLNPEKIKYEIGKKISVKFANSDIFTECGHGINLSPTLELAREWGSTILKVEVDIGDIACIPLDHKKFRVKKCKVLEIVDLGQG